MAQKENNPEIKFQKLDMPQEQKAEKILKSKILDGVTLMIVVKDGRCVFVTKNLISAYAPSDENLYVVNIEEDYKKAKSILVESILKGWEY